MSTPTLERIDLSALGFEDWEPKIPCEANTLAVNDLCTPKCDREATGKIVIHNRCSLTLSCAPCYKLYLQLVAQMESPCLCATCKHKMNPDESVFWEPLNVS